VDGGCREGGGRVEGGWREGGGMVKKNLAFLVLSHYV